VDNFEYELPSDFEDEEIDEEAAFTEEDKKLYSDWFPGGDAAEQPSAQPAGDAGLLNSEEEEAGEGESGEYNTDDFSEEVGRPVVPFLYDGHSLVHVTPAYDAPT
jgi:U3 small nucleolar RNA-associated protein 14